MSQRSFLKAQLIETDQLLSLVKDHPLMGPNLASRRAEIEQRLASAPDIAEAKAVLSSLEIL
jgi:hypothetical protein